MTVYVILEWCGDSFSGDWVFSNKVFSTIELAEEYENSCKYECEIYEVEVDNQDD